MVILSQIEKNEKILKTNLYHTNETNYLLNQEKCDYALKTFFKLEGFQWK